MKLQFKHQKFQSDCAKATTDVFIGQPYLTSDYLIDKGITKNNIEEYLIENSIGYRNEVLQISPNTVLDNLHKVQRRNGIAKSLKLEEKPYNLTIEMETGTGKTYTYIKTIYELNKNYGWSKFIVIVPNVAIREGVYKSFYITDDHFFEEYGKRINYFVYNSNNLECINDFAKSSDIQVMIINSQSFNRDKGLNINEEKDTFKSHRPIDVISKTNPILIIDEPQSVEGAKTKEKILDFNPLLILRYSATHKKDSIYNMIYRLDAIDAYNQNLVKKISVKGIHRSGLVPVNAYVKLNEIKISKKSNPTANITFESKKSNGITKKNANVGVGYDLYANSGNLEEYKEGFIVSDIRGDEKYIEFQNGIKIYEGEIKGELDEKLLRRIQIRETIKSHFEREKYLYDRGIKVLSLFFIDEVSKYRVYDNENIESKGIYAEIFEEEYGNILKELDIDKESDYYKYLMSIDVSKTHNGYFSIDKKGKMIDGKISKEGISDDVSAYDLIMKNKELLLDIDPIKSPVRFIFSHSALREGWDNPNVFQICTLKESLSDVKKHQEIGRGLRLCVDKDGQRMDYNYLNDDIYNINKLTVITSESYDEYVSSLQSEIAESCQSRIQLITKEIFIGKSGIDENTSEKIIYDLIINGYVDRDKKLTDKFYKDKNENNIIFDEEFDNKKEVIINILHNTYSSSSYKIENPFKRTKIKLRKDILESEEFKGLWEKISPKTAYTVNFSTKELIDKSVDEINKGIEITPIYFEVVKGELGNTIKDKESLEKAEAFSKGSSSIKDIHKITDIECNIKYDLIGKIVDETFLTRKTVAMILKNIEEEIFNKFKESPEEFISKISEKINDIKAQLVINNITYQKIDIYKGVR